jgi:RNase P subunit RPR2
LETPVPIPNTEVKLPMLTVIVADKLPSIQAVFFNIKIFIFSYFSFFMEKISKTEAKEKIEEFFSDIKNKTPRQIRKMKKLAMKHSIKLEDLRKKFCKKCYSPDLKIKSVKKKIKTIECGNCGNLMRWKVKTS